MARGLNGLSAFGSEVREALSVNARLKSQTIKSLKPSAQAAGGYPATAPWAARVGQVNAGILRNASVTCSSCSMAFRARSTKIHF